MKSTIFIPQKCKVGFNKRQDTYTGKLGYVIYNDGKKWRKEDSWNGWIETYVSPEEFESKKIDAYNKAASNLLERANRNNGNIDYYNNKTYKTTKATIHTIEEAYEVMGPLKDFYFNIYRTSDDPSINPFEFDNTPMDGFVLNKKAGGYSSGWNARQTYCRVYDPRGFEFEVNIPNLLYILENANSIKGKGLEGKFVYGWDGKDLVLVPEDSPEFKEMLEFSALQNTNVKKSELILGGIYLDSSNNMVAYLGDGFEKGYRKMSANKKTWFARMDGSKDPYICTKDIKSIKKYTGNTTPEFANLVDKLEKKDDYVKNKPEFELIPDVNTYLTKLFASKNSVTCWAKNYENKMVGIEIYRTISSSWHGSQTVEYTIYGNLTQNSRRYSDYNRYNSIENLTNKVQLWQLKTTK